VAIALQGKGKPAWSVGGIDGEDEPKLAGHFFLGPPLPSKDRLYVLAEVDGMIRLCTLRAASGRLEWSLNLAQPETDIAGDPVRRMAGAAPSLSEGILICPTSAGAVAAVDPVTHALLWGFQYPLGKETARNVRQGMLRPEGRIKHSTVNRSVADASAVLVGGRALLLPVEAEQLFCLDSESGKMLWSCPREEMLFIACVADEKVILAGEGGLYSRNLQNGKPAWRDDRVELPGKSLLAGRGILVDNFYYLPSTTRELVKIDLHAGRVVEQIPTKVELGNLTAVRNLLFSHAGDSIQAFSAPEQQRPKK
jgi:outer membrane protein assembly factor BamB